MTDKEFKSERRQRQRNKDRRGMQVTNNSIFLLARLSGTMPTETKPPLDKHEKMVKP